MNPNQPSQGQPGPGQQSVRIPMYKPEHMQNLEILAEADKEKYERGLRTLWDTVEKNGPETQAHQAARQKIIEFSRMVYGKVTNMRRQQQQQQQQAANTGTGGQPGQQINPAQLAAAQRAAMAAQNRAAGMPGNAVNQAVNGGPSGAQAPPRPQVSQGVPQKVSQELINHANSIVTHAPPPLTTDKEKAQRWLNDMRAKFIRAATLSDASAKRIKHIEALLRDREAKGNPLGGDELKKMQDQLDHDRKTHNEATTFVTSLRKQQEQLRNQQPSGAGQNAGQQQRAQQTQNAGNPMQAATSSVIAAIDAAKNPQSGAANRQQAVAQTPITQGASGAPTTVQTTAASNPSHPAAAPQPQVKIEPGTHPHPPPVNTSLAATAASNSRMPAAGTPTHNSARVQTPQTATPTTATAPPGAARSLSHQDAVSMANNANSRQVSNSSVPSASQPNPTTTPSSGGLMSNAPQGSHPHAHPQQTTTSVQQFKHQIPRVLTERAQEIPQPVAIGGGVVPGRPTMSGGTGITGGTMSQPVVTKTPAYTFDVEGEHVLSKRKLDELVRQVCGGGPPGADGNYLTPDVEESMLQYADNFIDDVIGAACRLAKERGSKVLEVRDLQLVLERVHNIRIPGYTSDELRTVRKVVPNANWINKLSAVTAAKVTSQKDDK